MLKVRCSNGLQVSAYHGNFLQHVFHTELELGSIDADKTIGVLFSHDGKLDPQLDAHFQSALLYTTASGERRVRCINIVAAVNSGGMDTMRSLDQDAIVNIIAKEGKKTAVSGTCCFVLMALANYAKQRHPVSQTNFRKTSARVLQRKRCKSLHSTGKIFHRAIPLGSLCCRIT